MSLSVPSPRVEICGALILDQLAALAIARLLFGEKEEARAAANNADLTTDGEGQIADPPLPQR